MMSALAKELESEDLSDQEESIKSCTFLLQVFMAEAAQDDLISDPVTLIAEQTPEQLEATRYILHRERAHLARQQCNLELKRGAHDQALGIQKHGRQVNDDLNFGERDGVTLYLSARANLIAATFSIDRLNPPVDSPGYVTIWAIRIQLKEAAVQ